MSLQDKHPLAFAALLSLGLNPQQALLKLQGKIDSVNSYYEHQAKHRADQVTRTEQDGNWDSDYPADAPEVPHTRLLDDIREGADMMADGERADMPIRIIIGYNMMAVAMLELGAWAMGRGLGVAPLELDEHRAEELTTRALEDRMDQLVGVFKDTGKVDRDALREVSGGHVPTEAEQAYCGKAGECPGCDIRRAYWADGYREPDSGLSNVVTGRFH